MFASYVLLLLLIVGFFYGVYRIIIAPRLPDEKCVPEYLQVLEEKLEKLTDLREELEAVREEKEVTQQILDLDAEIDGIIEQIKAIENA